MSTTSFKQGDIVRFVGGSDEWTVARYNYGPLDGIRIERDLISISVHYSLVELVRRPKQKVTKRGWVNVCNGLVGTWLKGPFESREDADAMNSRGRIACVEITWDEGER